MALMRKTKALLLALVLLGMPLATTATCDPYAGVLGVTRYDDHDDFGVVEVIVDDGYYYDDCYDCFYEDEYFYEELIFWDD